MSRLSLISFNTLSINLKSGVATFSGDGVETEFIIPHGAVITPTAAFIEPQTTDAFGSFTTTVDATNITVTYTSAPLEGTDNLVFGWMVV
jgi:hypothetical protein